MIDDEDRNATAEYGPWPWIAGLVLAGVITTLMFTLSSGRF